MQKMSSPDVLLVACICVFPSRKALYRCHEVWLNLEKPGGEHACVMQLS